MEPDRRNRGGIGTVYCAFVCFADCFTDGFSWIDWYVMLTAVKDGRGSELEMPQIVRLIIVHVFHVGFSLESIFRSTVCGGVCGILWCIIALMYCTAYKHHGGG